MAFFSARLLFQKLLIFPSAYDLGGKLLAFEKWALGARRSAAVNCFWRSAPWKFFGNFNHYILFLFYLVCHSPLFKFNNNLFLKCGAFNIQAYKHF